MKKLICIVDYGLGNIHSAEQSIKKVAADSNMLSEIKITSNPIIKHNIIKLLLLLFAILKIYILNS